MPKLYTGFEKRKEFTRICNSTKLNPWEAGGLPATRMAHEHIVVVSSLFLILSAGGGSVLPWGSLHVRQYWRIHTTHDGQIFWPLSQCIISKLNCNSKFPGNWCVLCIMQFHLWSWCAICYVAVLNQTEIDQTSVFILHNGRKWKLLVRPRILFQRRAAKDTSDA
jgi:hypothetical protein